MRPPHRIVAVLLGGLSICPVAGTAVAGASGQADFVLARRYERGLGLRRDPVLAAAHYCAAARQGHRDAAFSLGWMHLDRPAEREAALAWIGWAAAMGHLGARRMVPAAARPTTHPAGCPGVDAPPTRPPVPLPAPSPAPLAVVSATRVPRAPTRPVDAADVLDLIRSLAPVHGLDPALVEAVVAVESGFRADAVSPRNAQGLMQLIPATARRFGVSDPFDPADNLQGGMRYLRWLIDRFDGDLRLALAGYNAGEGAVDRHRGVPPYAETRRFVRNVLQRYRVRPGAADG